jgi:hypothetical protein
VRERPRRTYIGLLKTGAGKATAASKLEIARILLARLYARLRFMLRVVIDKRYWRLTRQLCVAIRTIYTSSMLSQISHRDLVSCQLQNDLTSAGEKGTAVAVLSSGPMHHGAVQELIPFRWFTCVS